MLPTDYALVSFHFFDTVPTFELTHRRFLNSVVNSTFIQLGSGCDSIHQTDCQIALDPQNNGTLFLPPIQSAMISTRNKVSIKYGRVVIKAKMPRGCVSLSVLEDVVGTRY